MSLKNELVAAALAFLACLAGTAGAADLVVAVRDPGGKPLEDAVIYAEPLGKPGRPAAQPAHAVIDQVNRQFVPLVTILRTGTEVSFPNSDNIRHSIYSFSPAKVFTTKLYSGKQAAPLTFDQPGLVVLGCNIHDTMAAWVVVVDTPFFTKSGANGTGTITGLEPGAYQLSVWYPGPQFEPVVSRLRVEFQNVTREVQIDGSASSLPALRALAAAKNAGKP